MHIFKHLREKIVNFIHLPDLTIFPVTASSLARRHGGVEESRAILRKAAPFSGWLRQLQESRATFSGRA